jgi:hypothetical protein
MNNGLLFIWGLVASFLAVGPQVEAVYLDWQDKEKQ